MSHATMYWAMEQKIPSMPKLTLIMLAKHADQKHQCFPSLDRLANLCQCHRRSISRNLKFLTENKLITELRRWRPSGGQTSSLFTLHVLEQPGRQDKTSRHEGQYGASMGDTKYHHEGPNVMHMDDTVSPIIKEEPSTINLNCPSNPPPTPSKRMRQGDPTVLSVEEVKECLDNTTFSQDDPSVVSVAVVAHPTLGLREEPSVLSVGVMMASSDHKNTFLTPAMVGSTNRWDVEGAFKRFWACYPHKVHYGKAWEIWQKLVGTPELANTIIDDVQQRCRYHAPWVRAMGEGTLRYIPLPANYLDGTRWMDAIEENRHGISGNHRQGNFERITGKIDELLSRCRSGQGIWDDGLPGGLGPEGPFAMKANNGNLRNTMGLSVW